MWFTIAGLITRKRVLIMDLREAISGRRSHRQYTGETISQGKMVKVLEAGLLAPSPKNRQPWYFVSCGPHMKRLIIEVLERKVEELTSASKSVGSLPISTKAIGESSEFLLVYNHYSAKEADYNQNRWKADILSIGACIQNMLLAAHEKNIQTLWICDILFAESEINGLMQIDDELVAGVILGTGTRNDIPQRPRMALKHKLIRTR
jgi:nitroreductase